MSEKSRREQIEEMLADEPNDSFLHYCLGMEHVSAGAEEEAVRCFHDLIRRDPLYVPTYVQLGQLLTRLDREEEARAVFREGISVARNVNDLHAAGEMEGFLDAIS